MSVGACAEIVARGDPDRFASAMTAPLSLRGDLMVLYAFNLSVAKAPWVTSEPMLAEMRMQWWCDALDEIYTGKIPRSHEVVLPLAALIRRADLPRAVFDTLIEARRGDIYPRPPPDWGAVWRYLAATGGGLMQLAALASSAAEPWVKEAHAFGTVSGAANLIQALPELEATGRQPLPQPGAAPELAAQALARIRPLRVPRSARPAFAAGWRCRAVLRRATSGRDVRGSEFSRRWNLLWVTLTGRF